MTKLIYSATTSLDGYIAGPGGDMSWLTGLPSDADMSTAAELMRGVGANLVGNTSFRGDDPNSGTDAEGAFSGQYDGPTVVLTHHRPDGEIPGVVFSGDLYEAVELARSAAAGHDYVNIIGADVARQCLAAGLFDEVLLFIAPIILGGGTRAFAGDRRVALEPLRGRGEQWYRIRYDG